MATSGVLESIWYEVILWTLVDVKLLQLHINDHNTSTHTLSTCTHTAHTHAVAYTHLEHIHTSSICTHAAHTHVHRVNAHIKHMHPE